MTTMYIHHSFYICTENQSSLNTTDALFKQILPGKYWESLHVAMGFQVICEKLSEGLNCAFEMRYDYTEESVLDEYFIILKGTWGTGASVDSADSLS